MHPYALVIDRVASSIDDPIGEPLKAACASLHSRLLDQGT